MMVVACVALACAEHNIRGAEIEAVPSDRPVVDTTAGAQVVHNSMAFHVDAYNLALDMVLAVPGSNGLRTHSMKNQ